MTILEDLQQVTPGFVGELGQCPFVDDQHRRLGQLCQRLAVAAVAASEGQVGEQTRQTHIQGAVPLAGRLGWPTRRPGRSCRRRSGRTAGRSGGRRPSGRSSGGRTGPDPVRADGGSRCPRAWPPAAVWRASNVRCSDVIHVRPARRQRASRAVLRTSVGRSRHAGLAGPAPWPCRPGATGGACRGLDDSTWYFFLQW
jgi:hypothetical protein